MYQLMHGDCLELMKNIPDGSVDMILCDLPYGTTQNKWDEIIPFDRLWAEYKRVIKVNGTIVLTSMQPFTSMLILSNAKWFKYCWVWDKGNPTGFGNAKKQPLRYHEDVCVFYQNQCTYNPIKWKGKPNHKQGKSKKLFSANYNEGFVRGGDDLTGMKYPRSIIEIHKHSSQCKFHPTQKPVALMEYLIKTYTNEGETVLDNCMGSGTTGVACLKTNRRFIGIEKDEKYFQIAKERIENESNNLEHY